MGSRQTRGEKIFKKKKRIMKVEADENSEAQVSGTDWFMRGRYERQLKRHACIDRRTHIEFSQKASRGEKMKGI